MIRLVGTEEVVDQMILFSHHVSSSASPTSMLMMIHGWYVTYPSRNELQACWYDGCQLSLMIVMMIIIRAKRVSPLLIITEQGEAVIVIIVDYYH